MKTVLGNKVAKILGYSICIISLLCFFILVYLGLFTSIPVKIEDIVICILCAIIFFIAAKVKGKEDCTKGDKS